MLTQDARRLHEEVHLRGAARSHGLRQSRSVGKPPDGVCTPPPWMPIRYIALGKGAVLEGSAPLCRQRPTAARTRRPLPISSSTCGPSARIILSRVSGYAKT